MVFTDVNILLGKKRQHKYEFLYIFLAHIYFSSISIVFSLPEFMLNMSDYTGSYGKYTLNRCT